MLLMIVTVSALGVFSLTYLSRALASSRELTLRRRMDRIVRFANNISERSPAPRLSDVFEEFRIVSPDSDVFVVRDAQNRTLFPLGDTQTISWPHEECIQTCISMRTLNGKQMRFAQQTAVIQGQQLYITLAGQMDEHSNVVQVVRNSFLISLPILLVVSLCGGLLLAHRALAPVDRITRAAQTISIRDLQQRLPVPSTGDELERLTIAWNDLLARLDTAVRRVRQFTSDLSHDLKTSLTVMSATAQVSIRRERSPQEQIDSFRTILLECESTKELLNDLLATARSDVDERTSHQMVPLSEIVEESCEQIRGRVEVKHLSLDADVSAAQWIMGDISLVRRLVMILLDNAVKYTPNHGHVRVSLHGDRSSVQLVVEDTGIGIAEDQISKIFDRFYRVDSSRNRDDGGNGLGLSIAKWIVDSHEAVLSVSSRSGEGSVFRVDFITTDMEAASAPLLSAS